MKGAPFKGVPFERREPLWGLFGPSGAPKFGASAGYSVITSTSCEVFFVCLQASHIPNLATPGAAKAPVAPVTPHAGKITVIACVLELCWNVEPFVLARTTTYRYEAKTHSRHVIGAHVGPKTLGQYLDLRWFKKVLVVIL